MNEEEFKKSFKWLKIFASIIGIICIITTLSTESFLPMLLLIPLIAWVLLTHKKKIAGPIIGIILGAGYIVQAVFLMIEDGAIAGVVFVFIGIFIIQDCIKMIKFFKK